ncbi:MAG: hypothetical protein M5U16_04200 [Hyphomicrobium sp.]|nr:hypothetical protein [Hyphomicrobium sp.]
MAILLEMIERHTDRQTAGKALRKRQEWLFPPLHRSHSIGQDEDGKAMRKSVLEHSGETPDS